VLNLLLSVAGLVLIAAGVWVNWGVGWACLVGGVVLFVTGGLGSFLDSKS